MKFLRTEKAINPLPYSWYFFAAALIAIIGLINSIYLALSHYRVYTDITYESFCAISRALNCDTVSQSPYSLLLDVPVPMWGIMGYSFFLFLLVFSRPCNQNRARMWSLLIIIALFFSLYSIILAFISTLMIHSYCLMCILGYAVSFMLLYFTWLIRKRFSSELFFFALIKDIKYVFAFSKVSVPILAVFLFTAVFMIMFFPAYWNLEMTGNVNGIPTGVTEEGHPWIGAENPELVITEFSDYRCFQCKKMHFYIRNLISRHPDKIRLVHRHFPMDHTVNPIVEEPFYVGSAKMAVIAIFAAKIDKFWDMNDILFNIARDAEAINIRRLGEQTGIPYDEIKYVLYDQFSWNMLLIDIREGLKYNITGTPGFVINGQVYQGQIPPHILREYSFYR